METFTDVINTHGQKFLEIPEYTRQKSGTGDEYKLELKELNQIFYDCDATHIVVDSDTHYAHPFWVVGELMTEIFGMNPPLMTKYKPEIIEWSYKLKPDRKVEYCYGERWAEHNQILNIIKTLTERNESKRAVLATFMPYDTDPNRKDVPCTVIHQFLIRHGKINTTTCFRSHDFFGGMKYDVYLSSFLTQLIAMGVNTSKYDEILPGRLFFYDGSLHVYQKDFDKLQNVNKTKNSKATFNIMFHYDKIIDLFADLCHLKEVEECSYWSKFDSAKHTLTKIRNPAIRDFGRVFINRNAKFNKMEQFIEPYETEVLQWTQ